MSRTRNASVSLALGLVLICVATRAHANAVSVNFYDIPTGGSPVTGSAGVVPFGNWNNLTVVNTTNSGLLDSAGNNSGASITTSDLGGLFHFGGYTDLNSDATMLNDGAYNNGDGTGSVKIQVSSIPYALYNVYVYANQGSGRTTDYSIGTTTHSLTTIAGYSPLPPYTLGGNYVEFTGVTGSSFKLSTQALTETTLGVFPTAISGIQIVDATPEPASYLLLGLGAAAMFRVARRRSAQARAAAAVRCAG